MIIKTKQNFTSLIFSALTYDMFVKLSKPRKSFIAHIFWLFASVKGMINFLHLDRKTQLEKETDSKIGNFVMYKTLSY